MDTFPIDMFEEVATKRPRGRKNKNRNEPQRIEQGLQLKTVYPKTESQKTAIEFFEDGSNLALVGSAGTGKTFLSIAMAMKSIMAGDHKKLIIVRSAVPTRDIGFLPGNEKQKLAVYEAPYVSIFKELFGRSDSYELFKNKKIVEFIPTSYVRGITIDDAIILVDECSNLNGHELDSIITRVGENSRIIFSGDFAQSDFTKEHERNGLKDFMRILDQMRDFNKVEFTEEDIVRSGLVRSYIINKNKLGLQF